MILNNFRLDIPVHEHWEVNVVDNDALTTEALDQKIHQLHHHNTKPESYIL